MPDKPLKFDQQATDELISLMVEIMLAESTQKKSHADDVESEARDRTEQDYDIAKT